MYVCMYVCMYVELFSLGTNFHKWTHYSRKFILGWWIAIAEISMDVIMTGWPIKFKPKAMGYKVLQSTIAAEVT